MVFRGEDDKKREKQGTVRLEKGEEDCDLFKILLMKSLGCYYREEIGNGNRGPKINSS